MSDTDISRVVSLIMENPALIEQIKQLAAQDGEIEPSESPTSERAQEDVEAAVTKDTAPTRRPVRRGELLAALKPYISDERKAAIESFITIADILDMMRTK